MKKLCICTTISLTMKTFVLETAKYLHEKEGYDITLICNNDKVQKISWSKDHFYFIDKPCEKRNPGYPLDSITIVPEFNKYLVELTEEDKKAYKKKDNIDEIIEFISSNV